MNQLELALSRCRHSGRLSAAAFFILFITAAVVIDYLHVGSSYLRGTLFSVEAAHDLGTILNLRKGRFGWLIVLIALIILTYILVELINSRSCILVSTCCLILLIIELGLMITCIVYMRGSTSVPRLPRNAKLKDASELGDKVSFKIDEFRFKRNASTGDNSSITRKEMATSTTTSRPRTKPIKSLKAISSAGMLNSTSINSKGTYNYTALANSTGVFNLTEPTYNKTDSFDNNDRFNATGTFNSTGEPLYLSQEGARYSLSTVITAVLLWLIWSTVEMFYLITRIRSMSKPEIFPPDNEFFPPASHWIENIRSSNSMASGSIKTTTPL